jgi:hypothetical protein
LTRIHIDPGICGFPATVEVIKTGKRQFSLKLTTECEKLGQLANQVETLNLGDAFKQAKDSQLYNAVANCLLHPACPTPIAIIKALEVEAGIALARNVEIRFIN